MPTSRHPQKRCSSSPGLARPHPLVAPGDPPRRHTPRPAAHPACPHHRLVMLATRPPSQCTTFASEATNATVVLAQDSLYADAKEQLGGYVVIRAPDLDTAPHWVARRPAAPQSAVEARPKLPPI